MSAHASNICPKCGGEMYSSGFDKHTNHAAGHGIVHGLKHGHPAFLLIGVAAVLGRALFPRKFKCGTCGYSVVRD